MAKFGERIKEITTTTGTGTIDLGGAPTGFQGFADKFTSGDEVTYLVVDDPNSPTAYEFGIGTFTSGAPNTLSRDTVEGSSVGGSKIVLAGTSTVIATPTSAHLPSLSENNVWTGGNSFPGWIDVTEKGAKGDGVTDDTTAIQAAIDAAHNASGGIVFFPQGTYICGSTIMPKRGVHCIASFGSVILKLKDSANTVLVESYLFDTLYAASAYQLSDNADMTYDYGFDGFIFDGNKANQTSGAYLVKMYGRRLRLVNCILANSKGVGLWTALKGSHSSGYDYTKTKTPGLVDNVEIVDCIEEAWVFEGSDATVGTIITNETGDPDNDGTTPQTSTHFSGGDVHGVYVKSGGFHAQYLNLNGTRFGRCLYIATGLTAFIDMLKVAGGWGNVEIESNVNIQINRIYSQANPYSWSSTANPHIWNKSDELQVGQCFITRVSGQDNGGDGFYDAGGAQVNNLEINTTIAGHGLVIAANDAQFPHVDIQGSTGTAADSNTSAAIRIESGNDWYIGGGLNNNAIGLQNLVDGAIGICDLIIDCDSGSSQIAIEGVVIRSQEPSVTTNSTEVDYVSLDKWRTYVRDASDRDFWVPDYQGNVSIADDAAVAIAPPGTTGKIFIYSWGAGTVDPNERFEGYFDAGSSFQLDSLTTGSSVTISNSARTGTDGTDAKLNIGGQTDQIHIENRLGGVRNIRYRFDV